MSNKEINFFALASFRGGDTKFGIHADDRRRHMYIIGKTGMGKTTMMESMIMHDIRAGRGVGLIDPHGQFAEKILSFIPPERVDDVIYFNPSDMDHPIGFNPLESVTGEFRHIIASSMMGVFKKIWPDVWSPRMEYILNNTLLALLEFPNSTLLSVMKMLSDKGYRERTVAALEDPMIKNYWVNEFSKYTDKYATEAVAAIQNKIGQFIANPLIRNIVGQPKSSVNMRDVMDSNKIFIANLSHGMIGEDNASLLGAMLVTKIQQAAMSRVNIPESERKDFFLYIDEFQNFSTDSFATILSEARKYRLSLIVAHQYIAQLNEKVRDAVFGNIGTMIVYRVGAEDADYMEREFSPEFTAEDLVNIPKHHSYIKLMIDGVSSRPFAAKNLPFLEMKEGETSFRDLIVEKSRAEYGSPRVMVEKKIVELWNEKPDAGERNFRRNEQPLSKTLSPRDQYDQHDYRGQRDSRDSRDFREPREHKDRRPVIMDELKSALGSALRSSQGPQRPYVPPVSRPAPSTPVEKPVPPADNSEDD